MIAGFGQMPGQAHLLSGSRANRPGSPVYPLSQQIAKTLPERDLSCQCLDELGTPQLRYRDAGALVTQDASLMAQVKPTDHQVNGHRIQAVIIAQLGGLKGHVVPFAVVLINPRLIEEGGVSYELPLLSIA
jgi:hypothetical protein